MTAVHVCVMPDEVLTALEPRPGGRYVDCTYGAGGHSRAILERSSPDGRVLALDRDNDALSIANSLPEVAEGRLTLVQSDFRDVKAVAEQHDFVPCDGVLFDLGLSSDQLSDPERGFSFRLDAALDMRYDQTRGRTAADILNEESEVEIADLLYNYGEERSSRRLASAIVKYRSAKPFARTGELVRVIEQILGGHRGRIHPATRTFQALRIAVNDELESLREGLVGAASILRVHGRLAVISFHSLEDRIVKRFVIERQSATTEPRLRPVVRKPLTPTRAEIERNVRARSAKLRVAERIALDQAA